MNKILFLALLGFAYLAVAASNEEESQSLASAQEETSMDRMIRSAEAMPGKNKDKKQAKKGKKSRAAKKKNKKNRKAKRKNRKGKGKKARKGKKNRRARKGGKKNRKARKGGKKKGNKKNKKNKKRKGNKKNRRNKKKGARKGGNKKVRQSTCSADSDCLTKAMLYLKNVKDKVANYQKQKKRIEKFSKVSGNKGGKKGNFDSIKAQLVEAGGGNASNIACQGDASSEGTKMLKEVFETMNKCKTSINESCTVGAPSYDKAEAETCNTAMTDFEKAVKACEDKTGSEACTCWKAADLNTMFEKIKKCDLSKVATQMASFKKTCASAFAKCRSANSDAANVIHACSSANSKDKLLMDVKAATANKAALEKVSTAAKKASARRVRAMACSTFTTKLKALGEKAEKAPLSPAVAKDAESLSSDPPSSCTAAEKALLKAAVAVVDAAVASIEKTLTALQESLQTLTGSTASASAIDAATTTVKTTAAKVTTSAPTKRFKRAVPME